MFECKEKPNPPGTATMAEYNPHRANMRNFLVGLTMPEMYDTLDLAVESGDADRVGYIEEFIAECLLEGEN